MKYVNVLPHGLELRDLIGEGNLALCRAADDFEEGNGVPFEWFARKKIRFAIMDAMRGWRFSRRCKSGPDNPVCSLAACEDSHGDAFGFESDAPPLEDVAFASILRGHLSRCLQALPERQRRILRWRYGNKVTDVEIARRLSISHVRVHQIRKEALAQMRSDEGLRSVFC